MQWQEKIKKKKLRQSTLLKSKTSDKVSLSPKSPITIEPWDIKLNYSLCAVEINKFQVLIFSAHFKKPNVYLRKRIFSKCFLLWRQQNSWCNQRSSEMVSGALYFVSNLLYSLSIYIVYAIEVET